MRELWFKLQMIGIPVDGPAFVFGDNLSVIVNTTNPASILKRKSNCVDVHHCQEGSARDEWRPVYMNTHDNVADLCTKPLPSGEKYWQFVGVFF